MPDTMTGSKEALKLGPDLVPHVLSPQDWTGQMLKNCFDNIDLISEHFYNYGGTHFSLAQGRQVPNDPSEPVTDWMRRPANHVRIKYEEYEEYEKVLPELVAHPRPINLDEWAYAGNGRYPAYPAYAWVFHEMFRHSGLFRMAAHTFAPSLLTRGETPVNLNANGLVFSIYRGHFGSIPVEVSGNSPQPKVTGPVGGEQPAVQRGQRHLPARRGCGLDRRSPRAHRGRSESHRCRSAAEAQCRRGAAYRQRHVVAAGARWRRPPEPSHHQFAPQCRSRFGDASALQHQYLRTRRGPIRNRRPIARPPLPLAVRLAREEREHPASAAARRTGCIRG